jgi:hypothetical protein
MLPRRQAVKIEVLDSDLSEKDNSHLTKLPPPAPGTTDEDEPLKTKRQPTMKLLLIVLLAATVACQSAQERKMKSPACMKARGELAEAQEKIRHLNQTIESSIRLERTQIETLEVEDRTRGYEGKPSENIMKIAQLKAEITSHENDQHSTQMAEEELEGFIQGDIRRECFVQE